MMIGDGEENFKRVLNILKEGQKKEETLKKLSELELAEL